MDCTGGLSGYKVKEELSMRNVLHEQFDTVVVYPLGKGKYRESGNNGSDRIAKKGDNTEKRNGFDTLLAASLKQYV